MHRVGLVVLSSVAATVFSISPARAQAWIEYTVTGAVSLENREEDVAVCSLTDEAFLVHTLGEWNVSLEMENNAPGEHAATFMVAAPDSVAALHDSSVDDRLKGEGRAVIEAGGTGQFGLPLVTVTFEATGLTSEAGKSIGIKGRLVCEVM